MTWSFDDGFVSTGGLQLGVGLRGDALAWYAGKWHWLAEGSSPELSTLGHLFGSIWCRGATCSVWGGLGVSPTFEFSASASLVSFDLDALTWAAPPAVSVLAPRYRASAADTGSAVILWGGVSGGSNPPKDPTADFSDGALFVP